eukprot:TRINITY_DN11462_c2_g1_i1.p1 TRINITY_DN11462_c2_g1~~TRINITY_DN11462_c2_g1_i1.p1  ORF type:complete len:730 (+),score=249.20 TRINITY_DN11462_c2_g1_i1:104-2191(+)
MAVPTKSVAALVVLSALSPARAAESDHAVTLQGSNPIRRVTNMLQKMSTRITEEGKKEEELYDKFMCHCKSELADFKMGKAHFEAEVPKLEAAITQTQATIEQIQSEIDASRNDEKTAKDSVAAANVEREKEHTEYVKEDDVLDESIHTIESTLPLLDKAMGAGFLQTKSKLLSRLSKGQIERMRKVVMNSQKASEHDRQLVNSFLSQSSSGPEGSTEDVKVILNDALSEEKVEEDANDKDEDKDKNVFTQLLDSKTEEIETIEETVAQKIDRQGTARVQLVELKGQLSDAKKALNKDFGALAKLAEACKAKTSDWEVRQKMRSDEELAIADTIKTLTSDDALEMFKKTLPSAAEESFIQFERSRDQVRNKALNLVKKLADRTKRGDGKKARFDMVMLALAHRGVDFSKVQKMIDSMVSLLKKEQTDDDDKKGYCAKQFFETEKKVKVLNRKIQNLDQSIAEQKAVVEGIEPEIELLQKGIEELDKAVAESTEQRKAENAEVKALAASNAQAKDLLNLAKTRMLKFYHPEQVPTTPAPVAEEEGSFFQVEIKAHKQAPEEYGEHKTQEGAGNTIITMLENLANELDAEVAEAEHADKASQKLYEDLMADSEAKRDADNQSIATKQRVKAEADTSIITHNSSAKAETAELKNVKVYEADLHEDCDWLNKNYETRKSSRATERETLMESKAVLAGAR